MTVNQPNLADTDEEDAAGKPNSSKNNNSNTWHPNRPANNRSANHLQLSTEYQHEQDKVAADMTPVCKELGISEARDTCLSTFVTRVRENLHVVLCVSPVGDALRVRCRNFPSLINCTTIDWFFPWPEAALVSVAERFIEGVPLPSDEVIV